MSFNNLFTCNIAHIDDYVAYLLINDVGFVTDGEWNSLRTKGNMRPLSVLQIRADVRAKYSRMGFKKLSEMLMPYCTYMCDCYAVCKYIILRFSG